MGSRMPRDGGGGGSESRIMEQCSNRMELEWIGIHTHVSTTTNSIRGLYCVLKQQQTHTHIIYHALYISLHIF
jgi:hypothetical protein